MLVRTVVRNREDRIRTCDILVPNQVLYQAELLLDQKDSFIRGESSLYRVLRTNTIMEVLLCHSSNDDMSFLGFCLPSSRGGKRVTTQNLRLGSPVTLLCTCTGFDRLSFTTSSGYWSCLYSVVRIQLLPYFDPRIIRCDTSFNVFSLTERSRRDSNPRPLRDRQVRY